MMVSETGRQERRLPITVIMKEAIWAKQIKAYEKQEASEINIAFAAFPADDENRKTH